GCGASRGLAGLHRATQLFSSGELWLTTDAIVVRERGFRPAWVPIPLVPALVMEQTFYTGLYAALAFAEQHLELSYPVRVEIGVVGVRGAYLNFPPEDNFEPIRQDEIVI